MASRGNELLTSAFTIVNKVAQVHENNHIYFPGQVNQKGKSPSKLAIILRTTKQKRTKHSKRKKKQRTNI